MITVPILFLPTLHSKTSFILLLCSILLMIIGLIRAFGEMGIDWANISVLACHYTANISLRLAWNISDGFKNFIDTTPFSRSAATDS